MLALAAVGVGVTGVLAPSSSGAVAPAAPRDASIALTVDGATLATFTSCEGIGSQTTPATSETGTKSLGTTEPILVTCDLSGPVQQLWAWRQAVVTGDPTALKDAELVVSGATGQPLQTYLMENAWVSGLDDAARVGFATTEEVTFSADAITATFPTSTG
jgi:hypothetical protein